MAQVSNTIFPLIAAFPLIFQTVNAAKNGAAFPGFPETVDNFLAVNRVCPFPLGSSPSFSDKFCQLGIHYRTVIKRGTSGWGPMSGSRLEIQDDLGLP
jgi:hypothetical protein